MSTTSCAFSRRAISGPSRRSFAQSSATTTWPEESGLGPRTIPAKSMNSYSFGMGTSPKRYMSASLPSSRSANVMARSEPRASPSGFSWVVTMKRSLLRRASATAARSPSVVFVFVELIDESGEAHPPLYRRIVLKRQLWGSLQTELAVHAALEDTVRGLEAGERGVALLRGPEHAHVDGGLAKVRARVDPGHGHEADARVLQAADAFREHLAQRLVHTAHAAGHSKVTTSRSTCPSSKAWPARYR